MPAATCTRKHRTHLFALQLAEVKKPFGLKMKYFQQKRTGQEQQFTMKNPVFKIIYLY